MPQPHTCRCTRRWGGELTAHCATCHETFSTVHGFDAHRRTVDGARACLAPATVGLKETLRAGQVVWIGAGRSPWAEEHTDEVAPLGAPGLSAAA